MAQEQRTVVATCTRDCPSACGLLAHVEGDRVVRLVGNPAHPVNKGTACRKVPAFLRRMYSPERVLTPLRKRDGAWAPVSWKAALDEMADRLQACLAEDGPESILHYMGFGERTALKILNARFFALLGGVTTLAGTLCGGTGYAAQSLDFGPRVSHDPLDLENARTIVFWGRNPVATQHGLLPHVHAAKKRGAKIILIDPRASESAALADVHLRPKPGRDAFLALAAAKRIVEKGWEDREFLSRHCDGLDAYLALLGRHSLDELATACDVEPATIDDLARAYVAGRPTATLLGWGLHRFTHGHELVRAVDALGAVSGNIGLPGGGVSQGFEEWGPYDQDLWGEGLHPPRRRFLMPQIGREILEAKDPPVKMAVITAANPVCMAPDSGLVARAFDSVPFVVHMNLFLDDTADHADLFLPCAAFFEQRDLVASFGHNHVGPLVPAAPPPGECRSQFDIFMDLATRFPFAKDFVKTDEEWLRLLARPLLEKGVAWDDLLAGPVRIPDAPMVPWAGKVFATPTGRFQLVADITDCSDCRLGTRYPYHFLTPGGAEHLCSERVPGDHGGPVVVTMATDEAMRLGIADGGPARLVSELGTLAVTVRHDANARPDVVACERGGWIKAGQGVNQLIPDLVSAVGQGTPYYEARVDVEKVP
ncbi:Nitrate reductase [Solidesulfovibrio carbinoliphilus subsp. oakridgensis]|uniref:Nitrate reductase n=1 Tax=Solidesulfovibrio carbinoliphilus subsp. oakridgensis TaxID=694327 RepID=G7QDI0_9BACT|nr:molybdopterin-dependent oxidoreductase [Solidesulfovibrio carbinoliphilus]EHJ46486.1 Nitrate reductase [Solidesulfovibrio carbinoliphilus subsp. oakridgensis]